MRLFRSRTTRAIRRNAAAQPLWPVAVIVAALYAPFVLARLSTYDVLWFVHIGREMLESSNTSTVITPAVGWQSPVGYDGQYYWALAVDPVQAKHYMAPTAGFVYSRPLYPALARGLGAGSVDAVPYTMLAINLVAVLVGTLAVAAWLRRHGRAPGLALLYGLFPGLIFCVFRDLTEPLAFGLAALAGLAFDARSRRAVVLSAILFALAGLARETTLLFAVVAAAVLVGQGWDDVQAPAFTRWRRAVLFLATSVGPLFVWRAVIGRYVSGATQERGDGLRSLVPFSGLFHYWPWDAQHWLIVVAVVVPTIASLLVGVFLLRGSEARLLYALLVLNAAAFVVFLPRGVYVDYGAAGRAALGVILAFLACLPVWSPGSRLPRPLAVVAVMWSLPWYIVAAVAAGLPAVALITS